MKVVLVKFTPWDKARLFNPQSFELKERDLVIAVTEFGIDAGRVVGLREIVSPEDQSEEIGLIDRLANYQDLKTVQDNNNPRKKHQALKYCVQAVRRRNLNMKLIDCHFSYDDRRLIIAFIAETRVDFRELVKELAKHFQRVIRLHQMGVRDEAKLLGDFGPCGLQICCRSHLKELGNVTSDLAEQQQVVHRGAERLSGICGRLKCCLTYESELYEELAKKLPALGTRVKTKYGRGEVVGRHILRGTVEVKIDSAESEEDGRDKEVTIEVPVEN